jgi:hypothetical protein
MGISRGLINQSSIERISTGSLNNGDHRHLDNESLVVEFLDGLSKEELLPRLPPGTTTRSGTFHPL